MNPCGCRRYRPADRHEKHDDGGGGGVADQLLRCHVGWLLRQRVPSHRLRLGREGGHPVPPIGGVADVPGDLRVPACGESHEAALRVATRAGLQKASGNLLQRAPAEREEVGGVGHGGRVDAGALLTDLLLQGLDGLGVVVDAVDLCTPAPAFPVLRSVSILFELKLGLVQRLLGCSLGSNELRQITCQLQDLDLLNCIWGQDAREELAHLLVGSKLPRDILNQQRVRPR
mmetsp:Transcript_126376/g.365846  ORF Transcript_126376/g.365846 Transcript_126376/m.365846 type:complete len:230 (+) Transcript_126376:982-1671(+)